VILVDVNVLVYACRRDAERHDAYHQWLATTLADPAPVGIAPESLAAVARITTHPRLWKVPLTVDEALTFSAAVRTAPAVQPILPGPGHWDTFSRLCRETNARGNLVMDAWLAALAVDQGCTLVTTDRDFARFQGLRWKHPLE
jgi:toxin-antitoxin system PIN domain toxin